MSKEIDDGGPAFPVLEFEYKSAGDIHPSPSIYPGMTKREVFAMAALQGLLASPGLAEEIGAGDITWQAQKDWAKTAVDQADCLIAELKKGQ